jgi:hypothetical protein
MCKFVLKRRTPASRLGVIRDVVVDSVVAHPRGTSTITGHAERPLENIRLSNVDITMRAENAVDKRATDALRIEHVRGARIRDLSVRWSEDAPEPKWQSALVVRRVSEFEIAGFAGRQGIRGANHPALLVDACEHGTIRNARATDGCRRLVHVQGLATRNIAVSGSEVPADASAVSFEPPAVERAVRVSG